jgi:predicted AlkP superfamily phosphohydrolase/phosphomutase
MKHKVAVFGLDGITFDLLQPWLDEGLMPNLARLMESGTKARMDSTNLPLRGPPLPPAATPESTA